MKNKSLQIIKGIIFIISTIFFSYNLMLNNKLINIAITIPVSAIFAIFIYIKLNERFKKILSERITRNLSILFFTATMINLIKDSKNILLLSGSYAMFFFITFTVNYIVELIKLVFSDINRKDIIRYIVISLILVIVIVLAYNLKKSLYEQYDLIYSIDSGWTFKNIFQNFNYYDIRHPLLNIMTYPIYSVVYIPISVFYNGENIEILKAIMMQVINIQLVLITAVMISKIFKNKNIFYFYMMSASTITYIFFFEKYQLCVFIIVAYLFMKENKKNTLPLAVASFGSMTTSIFIIVVNMFNKESLKEKIKKAIKLSLAIFASLCVFGRVNVITNGYNDLKETSSHFANEHYTIRQKTYSITKLVKSSFVFLSSEKTGEKYLWKDIIKTPSVLGVLIVLISLIGIISNYKMDYSKYLIVWSVFLAILFMILNWSIHESPLFNIYFAWAIIPATILGIEKIFEYFKLNKKVAYYSIISIISIINITSIVQIIMCL